MSVYVAQVRGGLEHRAVAELGRAGLTAYVPAIRRWCYLAADRRRVIEQPLLPGYAFVWSTAIMADLGAIAAVDGVAGVLENGGRPLALEGDWLERIWWAHTFGLLDHTCVRRRPQIRPGAMVRIIGGQFQGALAVLKELRSGGKAKVQVTTRSAFGTLILRAEQLEAA